MSQFQTVHIYDLEIVSVFSTEGQCYIVRVRKRPLTGQTMQQAFGEILNMRFRERLKLVFLQKVKHALTQKLRHQADMISKVELAKQVNAIAMRYTERRSVIAHRH